ncbi:MAG: hypothetical protein SF182_12515, partial [Deltaproteobacteria bacterium]|nr:hypothetical protein [Deltaproteobacteria bacterium]
MARRTSLIAILPERRGARLHGFGAFRAAAVGEQRGVVLQHHRERFIVLTGGAVEDADGALVERLGVLVATLGGIQERQVAEALGDLRLIRAQRRLADGQRAPQQRRGFGELVVDRVELGQTGQRRGDVEVARAQHPFADRQCLLLVGDRGRQVAGSALRDGRGAQRRGAVELAGGGRRRGGLRQALEARLGLVAAARRGARRAG